MSFSRHWQIYQSDVFPVSGCRRSRLRLRPRPHRLDEFAASYSLAGCTPAEPASALPAGSIFNQPAETVNHLLRKVGDFSIGRMGNFKPVLTLAKFGIQCCRAILRTCCGLGDMDTDSGNRTARVPQQGCSPDIPPLLSYLKQPFSALTVHESKPRRDLNTSSKSKPQTTDS
jgi:hypothetical protein